MSTSYLWKPHAFHEDFQASCSKKDVHFIQIASAYISLAGAKKLRELVAPLKLQASAIQIYCSATFDELRPVEVLNYLSTFATVRIVQEPFLHSKVYELHTQDGVTTYTGSANLTDGGLVTNQEMMTKVVAKKCKLEDFWEQLWQDCVAVTAEVIALYEEFPLTLKPVVTTTNFMKKLQAIYHQQCIESYYPDLTGYYFNVADYSIFNEKYWEAGTLAVNTRRKETQTKLYELNEAIQSYAYRNDLHTHYQREYLTSGIVPSIYNFGRVTGIWMRYGKHKSELQAVGGSGFGEKSSPIEQFHKHACLQLSIGSEGLNVGMFHSTANDGVDCSHVAENWPAVKEKILAIYEQIQGYDFVWTFYSNRENRLIATFNLDTHTAQQFIQFYREYYLDGYESFCMRFYAADDARIKTYNNIVSEVCETFDAMMPLYDAMTYRVPTALRA